MTGHEARAAGVGGEVVALRLVAAMSPHRPQAHPRPRGRRGHDRARARHRQGPQGRAQRAHLARHRPSQQDGEHADRRRARPTAASTAPCTGSRARWWPTWSRASRTASRSAGDPGRRLPRRAQGQEPRAGARLLAPGLDRGARGHRVRGARSRRGSSSGASTSSWSARSPPTSASSVRRSPTRARASATRASTSPGRSGSAHERRSRKPQQRLRRRRRVRAKVTGTAERPRISVFRSNRGISAQLIDDSAGPTRSPPVSWTEADLRGLAPMEQADDAGQAASPSARKAAGVETAVFDRGGYQLPRPRQGARRGSPRGRARRLALQRALARAWPSIDTVSPAGLDLQERVVEINRVAKVVKGGRRFSFTALVVVGDEKDVVGVGYGKANEVPVAIQKGVEHAKKNLFRVPKHGQTITHQMTGVFGSGRVFLKPASPRYRRHRRRRRARGARARRHPRHPHQEPRHPEPDQPRQGDRRRPRGAAHAARRSPRCAGCRSTRSSASARSREQRRDDRRRRPPADVAADAARRGRRRR